MFWEFSAWSSPIINNYDSSCDDLEVAPIGFTGWLRICFVASVLVDVKLLVYIGWVSFRMSSVPLNFGSFVVIEIDERYVVSWSPKMSKVTCFGVALSEDCEYSRMDTLVLLTGARFYLLPSLLCLFPIIFSYFPRGHLLLLVFVVKYEFSLIVWICYF